MAGGVHVDKAGGPVTENPFVYKFFDFTGVEFISISVAYNAGTRAITGITVVRTAACQYHRLLIGTSADGNPDDTDKIVNVPVGTTVLSQPQLNFLANHGVGTIEEFLSFQITAGP